LRTEIALALALLYGWERGQQMSPNELKILRLAHELKPVDKVTVARKMGISTEYAGYPLRHLCRNGCLAPIPLGANRAYALTEEGRVCLRGDLLQLRAQIQKKIDWLTYQRNRFNEKTRRLALGEVEEVKVEAPSVPFAQAEEVKVETAHVGGS